MYLTKKENKLINSHVAEFFNNHLDDDTEQLNYWSIVKVNRYTNLIIVFWEFEKMDIRTQKITKDLKEIYIISGE